MTNEEAYKLYKFAKMKAQLQEAHLDTINIVNEQKNFAGDYINEINFSKKIEIIDSHSANCYLRTIVQARSVETNAIDLTITVIYKGHFTSGDKIGEEQFEDWLDVQIIPQLLPYARTLITNITSLMPISPIILPTMDILESIKVNSNNEGMDGEG